MKKTIPQRALVALALAVVCAIAPCSIAAQQGTTTRYVYDDNGRLRAVIAPTGEATIYEYDAAGNFTAIRRATAEVLEIFSFSPPEGIAGDLVTFIGVGFAGGVNSVSFNGVNGRVVEVNSSTVVAEVPEGATTGPVTITTPGASATTSQPFVLRGVRVRPMLSRLLFGESLQFTVQVETAGEDRSVAWSVNGIAGGNATVGTISANGVYLAPNREATVTVRATSNADTAIFGEAQVSTRDPNNLNAVFAAVSVSKGLSGGSTASGQSVSVRYGLTGGELSATAKSVAVQYGLAGSTSAHSAAVSVRRGTSEDTPVTALFPVSVRYGNISGLDTVPAAPVTTMMGPHITAIAPNRLRRGTSVTITITGVNLGGATSLFFLTDSGAIDANISVSNLTSNADGTSLTATLTTPAGIALGQRTAVVSASAAGSLTVKTGLNIIEIISQ